MNTLGERLKKLRNEKGREFTQQRVAEELKIAQTTYSSWEMDRNEPSSSLLAKLANFYDISIDYLLRGNKDTPSFEQPIGYYWDVRNLNTKAKKTIAKYVIINKIVKGYSVFLDTGSTIEAVAEEILGFQEHNASLDLTILTSNMGVFEHWHKADAGRTRTSLLILTGGEYDKYHNALYGNETKESIERFRPDIIIMGTSGLSFDSKEKGGGLHCHAGTMEEVVKRSLIDKKTTLRIVACDHTKIGRSHAYTVCEPKELANNCKLCLIISTSPPKDDKEALALFNDEIEKFKELISTLERDGQKEKMKFIELDIETGDVKRIIPDLPNSIS